MGMLDAFLGNEGTKDALQAALEKNTLSHAVLLAAPDGCGRGFAARCLAADYLFPQGGPAAGAVMAGESPELMVLSGEGKSGQIPVARVRDIRAEVHLSALSAAGRVVWIRDAQRMAAPAFNALLKVLEEPPEGVLFILTAPGATALPATIRSRCALYSLAPIGGAECEAALQKRLPPGTDAALSTLLPALYAGRLGLCLSAGRDEARLAVLRDAISAAEAAGRGDLYGLLRVFSAYEGRSTSEGRAAEAKDADSTALDARGKREALLFDLGQILGLFLRGERLPSYSFTLPPALVAEIYPGLTGARERLSRFTTPKITLTALALQLVPAESQR